MVEKMKNGKECKDQTFTLFHILQTKNQNEAFTICCFCYCCYYL